MGCAYPGFPRIHRSHYPNQLPPALLTPHIVIYNPLFTLCACPIRRHLPRMARNKSPLNPNERDFGIGSGKKAESRLATDSSMHAIGHVLKQSTICRGYQPSPTQFLSHSSIDLLISAIKELVCLRV